MLHVYREGMTHRHAQILDIDKQTPLYRIEGNNGGIFSSKPHMKIYNAATNALVGTVTFQSWSHNIELIIHNKPVELASGGMFTSAHQYMSSATHGSFKRKNDGMLGGGDMLCLDNREQQVARSETSYQTMKEGKFELRSEVGGLLMDELVVSGIVMVEARRRKNSGSAGASGGGGGGGC